MACVMSQALFLKQLSASLALLCLLLGRMAPCSWPTALRDLQWYLTRTWWSGGRSCLLAEIAL